MGLPMSRQVIVLIDEPETHLHPRWQRTVLPSLQEAIRNWHANAATEVQLLVATHSPLVLASMEPIFDPEQDALWVLDLVDKAVELKRDIWQRRGDASRWLRSDVFDLGEATSLPAEGAIERARALMRADQVDTAAILEVQRDLVLLLPEMDPFLLRWQHFVDTRGGAGVP